jgi:hypothetical protein
LQAFTEQSLQSYLEVSGRAGSWPGISPRISNFYPAFFPITFANFATISGQEKTPTISDGGFFTLVL